MKNIIRLTGIGLCCSLLLSACHQNSETKHQVINSGKTAIAKKQSDMVYVVESLTEDGYILRHGDHKHFEKGWVPYDSLFTKATLMNDGNYKLDKKDILYKVRSGYIIRVKGSVYYYPKTPGEGIVGLKEARRITKRNTAHNNHDHTHDHKQEKVSRGVAGIDRPTSDGFLLTSEGQISQRTDKGIVILHNGHSHFLFYGDLKGSKWAYLIPEGADTSQQTPLSDKPVSDHYVFNTSDVVAEDANGYMVRHGDHYHYIFKSGSGEIIDSCTDHLPIAEKPIDTSGTPLDKGGVSDAENHKPSTTENPTKVSNRHIADKRTFLANSLGLSESLIRLIDSPSGPAFIYPHGDHHHVMLLSDIDLTKLAESPEEVERKLDYITKVYGVPREAIRVSDTTYSFNDPNHAYDPTHVHPYVILKSKLVIPEVTGDPETDFETELLAVSKRTGIDPSKIRIQNKQFIIPHGSHDHALNILATEGIAPYLTNKLPTITGRYVPGTFDQATVLEKRDSVDQLAKERYGSSSKEYRRIQRSLEEFTSHLNQLVTNSTKGYLQMLAAFEKRYVLREAEENSDSFIASVYNDVIQQLKSVDLSGVSISVKTLVGLANQHSQSGNGQALLDLEHLIDQLKAFKARPQISVMAYTDYLLAQVDSPYVPPHLQERLVRTIMKGFATGFGGQGSPLVLAQDLIELKIALNQAKQAKKSYKWERGEAYHELLKDKDMMLAILGEIRETFVGEMTFPRQLSKLTDEKEEISFTGEVADAYNQVLTLLRRTNLSEFGDSQANWLDKLNQASLSGDKQALQTLHHILMELDKFQSRPEMTSVEYMDYILNQLDKKSLQEDTREKAAILLNRLYNIIIRRESAEDPKGLAIDLVTLTVDLAREVGLNQEQPQTIGEQYSLFLQNSQEMRGFVEGVRDMLLHTVSVPEELVDTTTDNSDVSNVESADLTSLENTIASDPKEDEVVTVATESNPSVAEGEPVDKENSEVLDDEDYLVADSFDEDSQLVEEQDADLPIWQPLSDFFERELEDRE